MLCLAYHVMKQFNKAEIEVLWLSRIEIWGTGFTSIFSIFSVLDCKDAFHAYIAV